MMRQLSVGQLYLLALAEGEGVGTAYEYLAKRLVLAPWLGSGRPPERILVAGAPQKYGSSLDFALLAAEFGAALTVVDDRPATLEKFENSLAQAQDQGYLVGLSWRSRLVQDLAMADLEDSSYDLALSSEVLQRIEASKRSQYVAAVRRSASRVALFCPNEDNKAHVGLSGLAGLTLEALRSLTGDWAQRTGFIDMPPFPPGLTRTDEQREQATTGRLEALAMAGLGVYARLERFVPAGIRRRQAHIVFALSDGS